MQSAPLVLAIDQGTTSTRAVILDAFGHVVGSAAREFAQHYPQPGWVEHDAEEIWQSVAAAVREALGIARLDGSALACLGITNQRETVLLWERDTGKPLSRALVWQDRRTVDFCRSRRADEPWLTMRTGLVLDPYFSATKIRWLLQESPGLQARAATGRLACGTIDSFLIWRLTGGAAHLTDVTNASRTMLLNLRTGAWDAELCTYFGVPPALLAEVLPSSADFGVTRGLDFLPDGLPITGVAGDQQASLFGQAGFAAGAAKCTYGTGAFLLIHTGDEPVASRRRLLTTVAATTGSRLQYALEGSVFIAGAAVQWLRDGLHVIRSSADVEPLASRAVEDEGLIFVPALVGLGAPYWVPEARGVLFGITRGTNEAQLARAVLQGVGHQVADLADAAREEGCGEVSDLRADGGMARNNWFLQFQSDLLGTPVLQAGASESTALGVAWLAGLRAEIWSDEDSLRRQAGDARRFEPRWTEQTRARTRASWRRAVLAVTSFYQPAAEL